MASLESIPPDEGYQRVLRSELEKRCAKNPRYSLRAFARDLDLSASHLSGIMSGRYGLSREGAISISRHIGLAAGETEIFVQSVESQHARSRVLRQVASEKLKALRKKSNSTTKLELDHFQMISDWYHFAILELTYLKSFRPTFDWIAKALEIHPLLAKKAVERLVRLKLLKVDGETWRPSDEETETGFETPSAAIKNFHSQVLERAGQALQVQPLEMRDFRTTVFAIRKDRLVEAKKQIEKLHREFCIEVSGDGSIGKDDVYCLSTQLFNLSAGRGVEK